MITKRIITKCAAVLFSLALLASCGDGEQGSASAPGVWRGAESSLAETSAVSAAGTVTASATVTAADVTTPAPDVTAPAAETTTAAAVTTPAATAAPAETTTAVIEDSDESVHEHIWVAADCENPKTCKLCGATEGKKNGHDWQEATCTEPQTCTRCGKTQGTALGHSWKAATLSRPRTCTRCNATEGDRLTYNYQFDGYVNTAKDPLNLRMNPDSGATVVTTIPRGTQIQIYYCGLPDWYYTKYSGFEGYVMAQYISSYPPNGGGNSGGIYYMGKGYVNTVKDPLNLRSAPSTSASILTKIPKGTYVEVYLSNTDGWYCVNYNGYSGYAMSQYIAF